MSDPNEYPPPPGNDPNQPAPPPQQPPGGYPPPAAPPPPQQPPGGYPPPAAPPPPQQPPGGYPPPAAPPPPQQPPGAYPPPAAPPGGGYQAPPPPPPGVPAGYPAPPPGGGYTPYTTPPSQGGDATAPFSYGWKKFTENVGTLLVAIGLWFGVLVVVGILGFILVSIVTGLYTDTVETGFGSVDVYNGGFLATLFIAGIWSFAWMVANFVGNYGVIRASLAITDGRALTTSEILNFDRFVPFLLTSLLSALAIAIGSLLCYIPGLIAAFLFWLAPYYVVDRQLSPVDALKASYETMTKNVGDMIVFYLLTLLVTMIGAILCGVGLFVALPVVWIATAFKYRTINGQPVAP